MSYCKIAVIDSIFALQTKIEMHMSSLGRHVLVELYGCSNELLNDVSFIEKAMVEAAETAGATVINSTFHHFSPYGVSGVVVIQESHLAIHTWPEYGYAAIDLFTCGDTVDPWVSYQFLEKKLEASHGSSMELRRGQERMMTRTELEENVPRDHYKAEEEITPTYKRNVWFTERDENIAFSLRHDGELLFSDKSDFQKVEVYNTYAYGKMLTLDGLVMCTEKDEYVYHELITHTGIFAHNNVKDVLVIGGGDGGTVRELVKHDSIDSVTMVEIDGMVVDAAKKYLPTMSNQLENEKLNLIIGDGIEYLKNADADKFDMIIIDNSDPVGPSEGIFTEAFYQDAYRCLKPNGILTGQSESPRFNTKVYKELYAMLRNVFGQDKVHCYLGHIPTYPSGMWSFSFCSKGAIHPVNSFNKEAAAKFSEEQDLNYYNEDIHTGVFALPNFVKKLQRETRNKPVVA